MNVLITENGIETKIISVERTFRRKTNSTTTARMPPISADRFNSAIESRIMFELSTMVFILTPGGSVFLISSTLAFTRSATLTVFSPDCLRMLIMTPCPPMSLVSLLFSAIPSETSATSLT